MSNEILNRAIREKDNEFYTKRETVREIYNAFRPFVKGVKIIMPFDTKDSEFVKYVKQNAKNNGWTYDYWANNYQDLERLQGGVVISNPPFSNKAELINYLNNNGIKWVLILPSVMTAGTEPLIPSFCKLKCTNFVRPDGSEVGVSTGVFSNFCSVEWNIRIDGDCNHTDPLPYWRRGEVFWNCYERHNFFVSKASSYRFWMGGLTTLKMPDEIFDRSIFTKLTFTKHGRAFMHRLGVYLKNTLGYRRPQHGVKRLDNQTERKNLLSSDSGLLADLGKSLKGQSEEANKVADKFLRSNLSLQIKVFNDQLKVDKFNTNIKCLNLYYPAQKYSFYINIYADNITPLDDKFSMVTISPAKYYIGSSYSDGKKVGAIDITGIKLIEKILEIEQKEYKMVNKKDYSETVAAAHKERINAKQLERNL